MNPIKKLIIISFYRMEYVEYSTDDHGAAGYYFQHNILVTRDDGKKYIVEYTQSHRFCPGEGNHSNLVVMKPNSLPVFYSFNRVAFLLIIIYIMTPTNYISPLNVDANTDFYLHLSIYEDYTACSRNLVEDLI